MLSTSSPSQSLSASPSWVSASTWAATAASRCPLLAPSRVLGSSSTRAWPWASRWSCWTSGEATPATAASRSSSTRSPRPSTAAWPCTSRRDRCAGHLRAGPLFRGLGLHAVHDGDRQAGGAAAGQRPCPEPCTI
uniref:Putative secreted protein n=1 Tax=Ixodes scapularis TaxID=6945 RepID=A0A4D5RZQ7_IXOSC